MARSSVDEIASNCASEDNPVQRDGRAVLIVAYQFPPIAGAGVHRSLRLVRDLGDLGYEPIVLTIDDVSRHKSGAVTDFGLMAEIPADVKFIRTPSHEPVKLRMLLQRCRIFRIAWFILFPIFWENAALWKRSAVDAGVSAVAEHDISVVYTTSGPFSSLNIGRAISKRTGLPWVADLRDPYTDAYAWRWPSKLHWRWMRGWEKRTLRHADRLIVTSEATKSVFVRRGVAPSERIEVITNAF